MSKRSTAADPLGPTPQRLELLMHRMRLALDQAQSMLGDFEAEQAALRDRYAPQFRRHAADVSAAQEAVLALLKQGDLKILLPKGKKSVVVHALKAGSRKEADTWEWPEEDDLVALIRAQCDASEQANYLTTTTKGKKAAISDERRLELGINVQRGGDAVFCEEVKPGAGAALLALLETLPAAAEEAA